ncbi:hypothetical protein DSM104443_00947 [Usitatibacter rugosus]|uniref:DUF4861 domain-containing protein n=1 Tax=Usitatibacter rugosus TaxID=2732067 RepID=A0A6M4GS37_9PROT|nr:DUF4861 family protein [Usitatibacter rugosus]QJR09896.1 hypothetical protein DSM104443_00947 [Usitatibacter rugosus]
MARPAAARAALGLVLSAILLPAWAQLPTSLGRIVVRNDSTIARRGEVIEISLASLGPAIKSADLERVHVIDASGKDLLVQPMDLTGDHRDDAIAFQADVAAKGTTEYRITLGEKRAFKPEDFRVYGRFVRERFDDFAWENDKVAFRMYGEALETWEQEPLTSSTVDAWVKKTPRLVVDRWYLADDYHRDHGEGGDFYSAGKSRGCGGSGLYAGGRLYTSKNFRRSRVLSRGPIRLLFELDYEAWDVGGVKVRETKRVSLDAGSNFVKFESLYATQDGAPLAASVQYAAGIKKAKSGAFRIDVAGGVVRSWETLDSYAQDGHLGCAIVIDPSRLVATPEADGNVLLTFRGPSAYYVGTGWDRSGDFPGVADFDAYVNTFAKKLAAPLRVEVIGNERQ